MNLYEKTNYLLEDTSYIEDSESDIIRKLIDMFSIDLSSYENPRTLAEFIARHIHSVSKAIYVANGLTSEEDIIGGQKMDVLLDSIPSLPKSTATLVVMGLIVGTAVMTDVVNTLSVSISDLAMAEPSINNYANSVVNKISTELKTYNENATNESI